MMKNSYLKSISKLENKNILVTGATGLIGSALIDLLISLEIRGIKGPCKIFCVNG